MPRLPVPALLVVFLVALTSSHAIADSSRPRIFERLAGALKDTSATIDLFAGGSSPILNTAYAAAAVKYAVPSFNEQRADRASGQRRKRLFLSVGLSSSVLFAGYNPLFGGWNASHFMPIHQGFSAGVFAGGPYTGFTLGVPMLTLGGWVDGDRASKGADARVEPFAAITLTAPWLGRLGLTTGVRVWIMSPLLRPLVRPLRRPTWWLHERKKRLLRRCKRWGTRALACFRISGRRKAEAQLRR